MHRVRRVILATVAAFLFAVAVDSPRPIAAQGTLSALETDVDQIARAARPSVVTVFSQHNVMRPRTRLLGPSRRLHTRVGSGVAVDGDLVLTTASVMLGAEHVMIRTADGAEAEARVAAIDLVYNLALVHVDGLNLQPVRFADHAPQAGDWVMALGTSYGGQPTQSVGNVATLHPDPVQPLLQLTNTVYPGNSGGAALNARGELIGLVQGELGPPSPDGHSPESERRAGGMSFVQPVQTLRAAYETLRRDGRVAHGFLGVSTRSASVASDAEPGVRVPIGALVERVQPDGPAMKAGVRRGDLIVGFNRDRVEYAEHVARWVASTAPGRTVQLVWVRNDIQHQAPIVLGESPDAAPQWTPTQSAADTPLQGPHVADLERQIQQLNQQLRRMRDSSSSR